MISLFSPAKINLFLRVLSRRADGYHALASLLQAIDWGDTLHISQSSHDILTVSGEAVPCSSHNLIWRALKVFREKTGVTTPVHLSLYKHIPLQAGLGGGSSNAATALWGLNLLFQTGMDHKTLEKWGAHIGSDVAFFFSEGTAYCTGRGEQVESLPPLRGLPPLALCKPPMGLSTPEVFQKLEIETEGKPSPEELVLSFLQGKPLFHNDLEKAAFCALPALDLFAKRMAPHCRLLKLTGSGTSFLCIDPKPEEFFPIFPLQRLPGGWYPFPSRESSPVKTLNEWSFLTSSEKLKMLRVW